MAKRSSRASAAPSKPAAFLRDLVPDPENARLHPARNLDALEQSLAEVGAARSIVIDEGNVILAGNGLVEAAAARGIDRVQVVEADGETIVAVRRIGLTPEQKRRLALFDNRTAELARWDFQELQTQLAALERAGQDLTTLGWTQDELDPILHADWRPTEREPLEAAHEPTHVARFDEAQWAMVVACLDRAREVDPRGPALTLPALIVEALTKEWA